MVTKKPQAFPAEVTAVICSWDAEENIEKCLASLRQNGIGEIILVDANSLDKTRQIASQFVDKILTDPGDGLARARNIGIQEATGKYILNFGSDNIMPGGALEKMLCWLIEKEYSGVSTMTHLQNTNHYLAWAMDQYKKARYYVGERDVIGTPTLFTRELLLKYPYDNKMGWSDDGDLCDRLRALGHKFFVSDAIVYEIGSTTRKAILYRWKGYGRSDWEMYSKYSSTWSFKRKLLSWSHPFRNEFIYPLYRSKGLTRLGIFPFLTLITIFRYFFWGKYSLLGLQRN